MKRGGPLKRRTPLARGRWHRRPKRTSPELIDAREIVLRRSAGRCEFPGCLHVGQEFHHRLPRSAGGPDTAANGLWLCADHHRWVHAHPAESYLRGFLLRRGQNP